MPYKKKEKRREGGEKKIKKKIKEKRKERVDRWALTSPPKGSDPALHLLIEGWANTHPSPPHISEFNIWKGAGEMHTQREGKAKIIPDSPLCCLHLQGRDGHHLPNKPAPQSLSLPPAAKFSASRKEMNKTGLARGAGAQPRTYTHTQRALFNKSSAFPLAPPKSQR